MLTKSLCRYISYRTMYIYGLYMVFMMIARRLCRARIAKEFLPTLSSLPLPSAGRERALLCLVHRNPMEAWQHCDASL